MCDQVCTNLFERTPFAYRKAMEWSRREEEFVKRAGFVLMARLAVSDKGSDNRMFEDFLPVIKREAGDDSKTVRKAISWALRQIGKWSPYLNRKAVDVAEELSRMDSRSARWIGKNTLRELLSETVQKRLRDKASTR